MSASLQLLGGFETSILRCETMEKSRVITIVRDRHENTVSPVQTAGGARQSVTVPCPRAKSALRIMKNVHMTSKQSSLEANEKGP